MDVQTLAALKAIQQRNESTSILVDIATWVRIIGVTVLAVTLWLGPFGWLSAYMAVNSIEYGFLIAAVDNAHKLYPQNMKQFPQKGWQVAAALAGNAPGLAKGLFFDHDEIPDIILYACTNTVDEWGPTQCHFKYSMATWCQRTPSFFSVSGQPETKHCCCQRRYKHYVHTLACETWKTVQYDDGFVKQNELCEAVKNINRFNNQSATSSWVQGSVQDCLDCWQ